jgi:CDP-glucose 4,6-dehydratase
MPITEDRAVAGEHPYEAAKSCADLLARTYFLTYQLPLAIARMGIVYGGGDLNFERLVPGAMKSVAEGKPPMVRTDGKQVREFIYADDMASAYITLAEHVDEKKKVQGEAFNFGTEEKHSVLQVAQKAAEAAGSKAKPQILGEQDGGPKELTLSCAKARKVLGWKAKWPLAKGMKETAAWYGKHLKAKK